MLSTATPLAEPTAAVARHASPHPCVMVPNRLLLEAASGLRGSTS